jgi:hypothetical protein
MSIEIKKEAAPGKTILNHFSPDSRQKLEI